MIKFRTESGSIYTLYDDESRWESTSVNTRTKGGEMHSHSEVVVGQPVLITGPGLMLGARLIETTPVVEIING